MTESGHQRITKWIAKSFYHLRLRVIKVETKVVLLRKKRRQKKQFECFPIVFSKHIDDKFVFGKNSFVEVFNKFKFLQWKYLVYIWIRKTEELIILRCFLLIQRCRRIDITVYIKNISNYIYPNWSIWITCNNGTFKTLLNWTYTRCS